MVLVPLKFEGKTFSEIDELTDNIADNHEPHEFEGLVEIYFGGSFHFDEILVLIVLDRLIACEHFVEFLDSFFYTEGEYAHNLMFFALRGSRHTIFYVFCTEGE